MKIAKLFLLSIALSPLVTGCYNLGYNEVKYNPETGWSATISNPDSTAYTQQFEGTVILLKKGGIGTVLDRDGLRTDDGQTTDEYGTLATIPVDQFIARGSEGYVICAVNKSTNQKWCVDIQKCGGLRLEYNTRERFINARADLNCEGITSPERP